MSVCVWGNVRKNAKSMGFSGSVYVFRGWGLDHSSWRGVWAFAFRVGFGSGVVVDVVDHEALGVEHLAFGVASVWGGLRFRGAEGRSQ